MKIQKNHKLKMQDNDRAKITSAELDELARRLSPLVGAQFQNLSIPKQVIQAFEPSQIGTIVGTLMDALIPHLDDIPTVGLKKADGILGDREGYPDYVHNDGYRLELKLIYVDNPELKMKRPPTKREPSARLTQKVTVKNVNPTTDAMLLIAYQMQAQPLDKLAISPTIISICVLSMAGLVEARDNRLTDGGGMWFGNYETPAVLSKIGLAKRADGEPLDTSTYGRKESEGRDFNEDTNFGKLQRIPYRPLKEFIAKCKRIAVGEEPLPVPDAQIGAMKIEEELGSYE